MCNVCHCYPCRSGCPSFEDKPIACCDECGAEIYAGDTYYAFSDLIVCQDCVDEHCLIAEAGDE